VIFTAAGMVQAQPGPDVTDTLVDLGVPYADRYPDGERIYARNPWDLQAFAGHLYLAAGNSSNLGPAVNAGPVPVLRLDPATGKIEQVFQIDDEQIDRYFVFADRLYIPGHDPKESWELGNLYRMDPTGQWTKHRTIPHAIHTYALAKFDGKLFAGIGTVENTDAGQKGRSAVCISEDDGQTWTQIKLGHERIHALIEVAGKLFAVESLRDAASRKQWEKYLKQPMRSVFEYDGRGGFTPRDDLFFEQLLPDLDQTGWHFNHAKLVKPVSFGAATVCIGAACANDHQYLPAGVFVIESLDVGAVRIRRAQLPQDAMPWDLLIHDGQVFVLASLNLNGQTTNVIYRSPDAAQWHEVLRFRTPTFARSFAWLDGAWYIALGSRIANPQIWSQRELHPDTGRLFRIPDPAIKSISDF
jgi:hypothetical protein